MVCGTFPDQGWNPCPLHWQVDSLPLSHQGSSLPDFYMVRARGWGATLALVDINLHCLHRVSDSVDWPGACGFWWAFALTSMPKLALNAPIAALASLVAQTVKNLPTVWETRVHSIPGLGRSLEKGMAKHSSILAWRIPWTEEPGRLQSVGSQRVRHNSTFTFTVALGSGTTEAPSDDGQCLWSLYTDAQTVLP